MQQIGIYKVLTVTHRATDLKDLSEFSIAHNTDEELKAKLQQLKTKMNIDEILYLSTCNRITYLFVTEENIDLNFIRDFFEVLETQPTIDLIKYFDGKNAVEHIFQVASSVDSMVVGEREIFRQLREAYENCNALGTTGDHIRILMRYVVEGIKKIYATTDIGTKPVSVVSLAFKKLNALLDQQPLSILMIGAGQTHRLVAKFLQKKQVKDFTVYNRTIEKGEKIASFFNGQAYSLNDLGKRKHSFNVIFICTSSQDPILTKSIYDSVKADHSNTIIIDLSVPLNTHKDVVSKEEVSYIDIESLKLLAEKNLAFRTLEVDKVKQLINSFLSEFSIIFRQRQAEKAMGSLPNQIKEVKRKAIDVVFKKEVESLDDDTKELMTKMLDYMEKRCIGIPMQTAKELISKI